jgi:hypothetical protein
MRDFAVIVASVRNSRKGPPFYSGDLPKLLRSCFAGPLDLGPIPDRLLDGCQLCMKVGVRLRLASLPVDLTRRAKAVLADWRALMSILPSPATRWPPLRPDADGPVSSCGLRKRRSSGREGQPTPLHRLRARRLRRRGRLRLLPDARRCWSGLRSLARPTQGDVSASITSAEPSGPRPVRPLDYQQLSKFRATAEAECTVDLPSSSGVPLLEGHVAKTFQAVLRHAELPRFRLTICGTPARRTCSRWVRRTARKYKRPLHPCPRSHAAAGSCSSRAAPAAGRHAGGETGGCNGRVKFLYSPGGW